MYGAVLVVEQDTITRKQFASMLKPIYSVLLADSAQSAVDILDEGLQDVGAIVLDVRLGLHNGIEFIHELRSYDDWIDVPVLLTSLEPASHFNGVDFQRYGIRYFLYKPELRPSWLRVAVGRAIQEASNGAT